MMTVTFTPTVSFGRKSRRAPIVGVKNILNMSRLHWTVKGAYLRQHRDQTTGNLLTLGRAPGLPVNVKLVRIGPRKMDFDNYVSGFKGIRDAVAQWLKCDDGDESKVTFSYAQEKGEPSVRIEIEGKP